MSKTKHCRRSELGLRTLVLGFVCFFSSFAVGAAPSEPHYRAAVIRNGAVPGVRLSSGLTVCDEELRNGHWMGRYWDSSGQIVPAIQLESQRQEMGSLPVDAFNLEMEGQELSGTWKRIGANQSEVHNPDGLLVTVELESSIRPIRVKVNTLLSGGPVRWLEVKNSGQRPTAISNVCPWSGQLWHTPNFADKLQPDSEDVYDVGYAQYSHWGYEGVWRFDPVVNATKIISGDRGKSGCGHPTFFAVVYHHTPLTGYLTQTPRAVLEYVSPDKSRAEAAPFRTTASCHVASTLPAITRLHSKAGVKPPSYLGLSSYRKGFL